MTERVTLTLGHIRNALLVVLAVQLGIVVSLLGDGGLGSIPSGVLILMSCTALVFGADRRLAAELDRQTIGTWILAWRLAGVAVLAIATFAIAFNRYLPGQGSAVLGRSLFVALWVLVVVKGAAIGKLRPGGHLGLRVPWTMQSRLAWDRAHRTLGRVLFWGGLAGLAASFTVSPATSSTLWFALVATAVLAALAESWQSWRADPERTA